MAENDVILEGFMDNPDEQNIEQGEVISTQSFLVPAELAESGEPVSMDMPGVVPIDESGNPINKEEGFKSIVVPKKRVPPEQQCEALFQNWLTTHPNQFLSGHQKRMLKRQILRDCKKGKYNHIFNN